MRVALHHHLLRLRPRGIAAELAPSNKELLIGSKAIDLFFRLALRCLFECEVGNLQPRQIANGLAQNQLAVDVNIVWTVDPEAIELLHHARRSGLELLKVVRSPPVFQFTRRVVLRTLIVEAVRDLMPDYDPNRTIVHGVGISHAESRRLQNSCGEHNFVHQRVVIGVRGWWCHPPAATIHRLADRRAVVGDPKAHRRDNVAEVILPTNLYVRVVLPLIRIADFHVKGC